MALAAEKTIEYVFPSCLYKIGTGTTLAASTRNDFNSTMITIPDVTERVWKSVILEINWRDAFTTARDVSSWRIGITCGSNAVSDADYAPTAITNTGDHEAGSFIRDVTDYFSTNFGASASANSVYPSFAMSTASNGSAQNITAKLIITYTYSPQTTGSTIKTVRIPIQSGSTVIGLQLAEIGTTGTTPAPANQIPALDTFLPETGKTYQNIWFEIFGNDAGAATTDFSASYAVNDQASASRCLLELALNTGTFYYDIWNTKYTDNTDTVQTLYSISSSATSAFKVSSNLVNRFDTLGGLMCVTYTYSNTSTNRMNSIVMPTVLSSGFLGGTSASDTSCIQKTIWVEEDTPTLAQSGVLLYSQCGAGTTFNLLAGAQTARPYTLTALVNSGGHATMHRVDHNSGFTLAKGKNTLTLKGYGNAVGSAGISNVNGNFYLNYTSEKAPLGEYTHNHTTYWFTAPPIATGTVATVTDCLAAGGRTPLISPANYYLNDVGHELGSYFASAINGIRLLAELLTGEGAAEGWQELNTWLHVNDGELSTYHQFCSCLNEYNIDSKHTGNMDIETARTYRVQYSTAGLFWLKTYITYHNITYTVSGSLTGPSGLGANLLVDIIRTTDNYWCGSTTTSASGSFNTTVFDGVYPVYASIAQDATHVGRSASAVAAATASS
jgi:hypothetical protein